MSQWAHDNPGFSWSTYMKIAITLNWCINLIKKVHMNLWDFILHLVEFQQFVANFVFFQVWRRKNRHNFDCIWKMLQFFIVVCTVPLPHTYCYGGVTLILIGYRFEMREKICAHCLVESKYLVDACLLNSKQIEWNHSQFTHSKSTQNKNEKNLSLAVPYRMSFNEYTFAIFVMAFKPKSI